MSLEQRLIDEGYEDVILFEDYSYEDAFIGVTSDNRAVYDYDLMAKWLTTHTEMNEDEAIEWIDYNTIRSLPYAGELGPIVMYHCG